MPDDYFAPPAEQPPDNDPAARLARLEIENHQLKREREVARSAQQENARLKMERDLQHALSGRVNGRAAIDAARLLALDTKIHESSGELIHSKYGIGPEGITQSFLNGDGKYLLTGAGAQAAGKTAALQEGGWDIERATWDWDYNESWKQADPEGYRVAWDRKILETARRRP